MPGEIIETGIGYNFTFSIIFTIYSLFILVTGIWGSLLLPKTCYNNSLRRSIRSLVVSGVILTIIFGGYGYCKLNCRIESEEISGKLVVDSQGRISSWIIAMVFIASILNISVSSTANNLYNSDNACNSGKVFSYRQTLSISIGFSVLIMILSLVILILRARNYNKERKIKAKGVNAYIDKNHIEADAVKQQKALERLNREAIAGRASLLVLKNQQEMLNESEKLKKQMENDREESEKLKKAIRDARAERPVNPPTAKKVGSEDPRLKTNSNRTPAFMHAAKKVVSEDLRLRTSRNQASRPVPEEDSVVDESVDESIYKNL